jgi:hypothetical protein
MGSPAGKALLTPISSPSSAALEHTGYESTGEIALERLPFSTRQQKSG